jgi:hypothetical protein
MGLFHRDLSYICPVDKHKRIAMPSGAFFGNLCGLFVVKLPRFGPADADFADSSKTD